MEINARVKLTDEEINNIIVGAVESGISGIGYWAIINRYRPQDNWVKILDTVRLEDKKNNSDNSTFIIDETVVRRGINKIINDPTLEIRADIKNSILTNNMDAECYDCIIQVGLFGEILYC